MTRSTDLGLVLAVALVLSLAPAVVAGDGVKMYLEEAKLTASDGQAEDEFGGAVDIDGDTVLVGAADADNANAKFQGAAYVFTREGPDDWRQQAKLFPDDGNRFGDFGASVALKGDRAFVGDVNNDNENGNEAGAVYVFHRTGPGEWIQATKIVADDGTTNDGFGTVAVDGETLLVGAPSDDTNGHNSGSAYVFERDASGNWVQEAKLTPADGTSEYRFGSSLDLDGHRAILGASPSGAAYVFERDASGNWSQQAKLEPPEERRERGFGAGTAIGNDRILVGAPVEDTLNGRWAGATYVFTRNATGAWTQEARLIATDGEENGGFGVSVDLDDGTAVIGEDNDNLQAIAEPGGGYVFTREGDEWTEQPRLLTNEGQEGPWYVAIDGETIVAGEPSQFNLNGADAGGAFVFQTATGLADPVLPSSGAQSR